MVLDSLLKKKEKHKPVGNEKIRRSFLKTISWRIIGTLDTIVISWAITGTFSVAVSIGFIELITKMVLYFFHERAWDRIEWGKK